MTDAGLILAVDAVTFGFPQRPDFLKPVSLQIGRGQLWGIIGPNGAGKSTLLRLFAGLIAPTSGRLAFEGRDLQGINLRERARKIAFLPQSPPRDIAMSARDIVLLARYPHRPFGLFESVADFEITQRAMTTTKTIEYADRPLSTLSGGEAQRVHIAAALTQEPVLLLLDEPTAALDLYHQLAIFGILEELVRRTTMAVVVVTHDLNLAARFCTHVLLMDDGKSVAGGPPERVITPEILEPVYDVKLAALGANGGPRWLVPIATDEPRGTP